MKALTIQPPYPDLICLPSSDPRYKPVENRDHARFSAFRGQLLIHSGSSWDWITLSADGKYDYRYDLPVSEMKFGYIVAVCNVVEFFEVTNPPMPPGEQVCNMSLDELNAAMSESNRKIIPPSILARWPELATNQHVEGKYCMVLEDVRKFPDPVKYRGQQGLFDVPDSIVAQQLKAVGLWK